MRVIIDFEQASVDRWTGTVFGGGPATAGAAFDGRLHLLRLLEALLETTSADNTDDASGEAP